MADRKGLLNYLGRFFGAAQLPPVVEPKVKPKQQSIPSYITNTRTRSERPLPRLDRNVANTDTLTLRTSSTDTRRVIQALTKVTPDLSSTVFAYARTAITPTYTAMAHNMDGTFNRDATLLLHQLLTRFNTVHDYNDGFSGIWALNSIAESLVHEIVQYGACAIELVLGKDRLPRTLYPVSVLQIQFKEDDKWLKPVQVIGQDEVDLDLPTFFYSALDQDLTSPYSDSPLEAAVQAVLADNDFFNDLRRLVKRFLHPRVDVSINALKFFESLPQSIKNGTEEEQVAYHKSVIEEITQMMNNLNPEDALIHFDFIEVDYLNHGTASPAGEEEILQNIARSRLAAGAKTLPSVLGHSNSSQNVASTESMLFIKNVTGVQRKLNELMSRALTLAVRLFGQDVYVDFHYDPINLRPEDELEAFRAMKQSRILELLSLGFLTDDQASIQLTGSVTPTGFVPLSGTGFHKPAAGVAGNPYSTTGSQGDKSGPLNRTLEPDTPKQKKS